MAGIGGMDRHRPVIALVFLARVGWSGSILAGNAFPKFRARGARGNKG